MRSRPPARARRFLPDPRAALLGDLVEVLYGERRHPTTLTYRVNQDWGQVDYCKVSYADEIEPEEIESSEKVSVTWELRH